MNLSELRAKLMLTFTTYNGALNPGLVPTPAIRTSKLLTYSEWRWGCFL